VRRRITISAAIVLGAAALIAVLVLTSNSTSNIGKPAPPLPSAVLQPPKVSLATLRGKPALVNFWASWCDPCRAEAPELERLDRSLHGEAHLVGIDYTDQEGSARSFIEKYGWTFPVLSDPDGIYGARYKFRGLPTTIVLNSKGKIAQTLYGPQTVSDFRRALEAAD
jgi:thiol-disulfide isomerase/thioredoxin